MLDLIERRLNNRPVIFSAHGYILTDSYSSAHIFWEHTVILVSNGYIFSWRYQNWQLFWNGRSFPSCQLNVRLDRAALLIRHGSVSSSRLYFDQHSLKCTFIFGTSGHFSYALIYTSNWQRYEQRFFLERTVEIYFPSCQLDARLLFENIRLFPQLTSKFPFAGATKCGYFGTVGHFTSWQLNVQLDMEALFSTARLFFQVTDVFSTQKSQLTSKFPFEGATKCGYFGAGHFTSWQFNALLDMAALFPTVRLIFQRTNVF